MSVVLASAPDRQANLHLRSAPRAVGGLRVTTVVAGDGPHDRETQSNAAVVSGPSRIGPAGRIASTAPPGIDPSGVVGPSNPTPARTAGPRVERPHPRPRPPDRRPRRHRTVGSP